MDSNNTASNNAIQTPKWRYIAMENTGNGVTTEVVMQWVGDRRPAQLRKYLKIGEIENHAISKRI